MTTEVDQSNLNSSKTRAEYSTLMKKGLGGEDILLKHPWNEERFEELSQGRKLENLDLALSIALNEMLLPMESDSVIMDWGAGDGDCYPYIPSDSRNKHDFILIEPSQEGLARGRKKNNFPIRSRAITKSTPPYEEVPDTSVDAVLGISTLHIVTEDTFQKVAREFARVLKPGGTVQHLQDVMPSIQYYSRLSPERQQAIGQYISQKYGLDNITIGNIAHRGGFFGIFLQKFSDHLLSSPLHTMFASETPVTAHQSVDQLPELDVLRESSTMVDKLARYCRGKHYKNAWTHSVDGLVGRFRRMEGKKGIEGIISTFATMSDLFTTVNQEVMGDTRHERLLQWMRVLQRVMGFLENEIFEGYTVSMLSDAGFEVTTDNVIVFTPCTDLNYPSFRFGIEGGDLTLPVATPEEGGQLISIRRVIAQKPE